MLNSNCFSLTFSIGYPVVTLGFGFKSYVGYRMRQRKQREVSKENEFYMQLLQQALPQEEPSSSEDTQTVVATNTSNVNAIAAVASGHTSSVVSGGAQNQHNHNGNTTLATGASLTAAHTQISNSIATANGSVALAQNHQQQQQQNHQHNHHQQQEHQQQQHYHHNNNNHNGNSFTTNGTASMASSATITGVANSNSSSSTTTTTTSSSTSNNNNNNTTSSSASYLSTALTTASAPSSTIDDKSYVQIGGGSGGKFKCIICF